MIGPFEGSADASWSSGGCVGTGAWCPYPCCGLGAGGTSAAEVAGGAPGGEGRNVGGITIG